MSNLDDLDQISSEILDPKNKDPKIEAFRKTIGYKVAHNPPRDSFWSVPSDKSFWFSEPEKRRAQESEIRLNTNFGCPGHPAVTDPETEKQREAMAGHVFFDDRNVDESGEPEYFDMFGSEDEEPQRCYNRNYKAPTVVVSPGVHYRDVRYESVPVVSWALRTHPKPNVAMLLLLCVFLCIVCR